jgi:hypothetical protein
MFACTCAQSFYTYLATRAKPNTSYGLYLTPFFFSRFHVQREGGLVVIIGANHECLHRKTVLSPSHPLATSLRHQIQLVPHSTRQLAGHHHLDVLFRFPNVLVLVGQTLLVT